MARKRKSKPTGPRRREEQQVKDRLAHAQDDAQRLGLIDTVPEEALGPARVDPLSQTEQPFPTLVRQAIRRGWAVPDEKKPGLVDELVGVVEDPDASQVAKVMAFNSLAAADKLQHERDQQYVKLDRVLEMIRGILEAIRTNVSDPVLLKTIVADVLRFVPAPATTVAEQSGTE